ncbi:hypothetical protein HNY73_023078 [Argiope bruennichi]|uniref:E3 ubiquitin-protein ligase APD1-4 middle domain-containing protein n=1 Tax=Argiope bruennichi TaxID=94029 RepID=A0A8T0E6N3_ARGBR|nr:hypothetical protein HNY73_023078 [Argiope bruennichi]
MASHALITLVSIILAVIFFSVPLVVKYHVYKPQKKIVVAGDVITVDAGLSSVWCQGVEFSANSKFRSFLYDTEPAVDESEVVRTVSTHHITLPNKAQEYWGFRLLRGSSVNITSCARLIRADVTVVKGIGGLKKCLREHRKKSLDDDFSGEDSQSQSESDEDTSSISSSQGVLTNETDILYVCSNSLLHEELPISYTCTHPFTKVARQQTLSQYVTESDYYYYVFSSNTYLDILPNEFSIVFTIDRTHFNYSTNISNCSKNNSCQLSIPIGSHPKVVVQMEGVNGTLRSEKLQVTCKPREWIFLIFYALFLIVIFLCAFQ